MVALFNTQAKVIRYTSTKDSMGQKIPVETTSHVYISISPKDTQRISSPAYADVNFIGICSDKTIDDSCILEAGEVQYKVKYAQPLGRFNTLYLVRQ